MKFTVHAGTRCILAQDIEDGRQVAPLPAGNPGEPVRLQISVPIRDMHGYWTPETRTPSQKLHWTVRIFSSTARHFPYLCFFNREQRNVFTLALDSLTDDTEIVARMNQATACYDITATWIPAEDAIVHMTLDRRPQEWATCLADWRASLGILRPPFPAGAWEPVFCTWYAAHAAVSQTWVETQAAPAADLGFGTLIVDDGWCYDQEKRVSPETIGTWYEPVGDWQISTVKFPDFRVHVERVRALGLQYMLWVAPALIGRRSALHTKLGIPENAPHNEGAFTLDPDHRAAVWLILDRLAALMEEYPLDGLKVDFLDTFLPNLARPTGRAVLSLISDLSARVRRARPDALIEYRQTYATPGLLPYATQFRAGDVPFDALDNFNRLCQIRTILGSGVPVHADPAFWRSDEDPVNISRHMIAALAGVPMLSMDLAHMRPEEKETVRHWLRFYREHRGILAHGTWEIRYDLSNAAFAAAATKTGRIVIVNQAAALPRAVERDAPWTAVLNLSESDLPLPGADVFDGFGRSRPSGVIPRGGLGTLS